MNIVSLFAGCGGLDLGFEKAGFNVIWANEYDKSIFETYKFNHPKTILNTFDIRSISSSDIPNCDGIIGGPPCQAWSEGGKRLGIDDPRGRLFLDYIRIVTDKKPKFFLIENVPGILDNKHKDALESFLDLLSKAGYNITYELINAADYKIPQDRYRVFFIGIRKDIHTNFSFPDACNNPHITLRKAIGDIKESPRFFTNETIETEHPSRLNHDVYCGPYDNKYMARNRVRSWDEVSFTIQAQARNTPQHPQAPKMIYINPQKRIFAKGYENLYRRLSVRECARIQSFPDKFRFFYNKVENGYKMVGNAVPPRLAWYLAVQIEKAFNNINISDETVIQNTCIKHVKVETISKQYKNEYILNNNVVDDKLNLNKSVLISLVKNDTKSYFSNQSASLYYTGKTIPSNIQLNNLYYFMPYIKRHGVRDLYIIKAIRTGYKKEIHKNSNDNSIRIIFEIQFVKQLFRDYVPLHLNIWRTYTKTQLNELVKINEYKESLIEEE